MATAELNGLMLHYQWQGPADGPVLVLINGLLTDLTSWNSHLPFLTKQFRVLTYDCRGQGGSAKPESGPYTAAVHARDLQALLAELGVEQAALLGVSSGACIAMQLATWEPERATALVLANGYGRADTMMKVKLNSWLAAMAAGGGPLRFDIATPWVWGATFLNSHFEALKPFREKGSNLPIHAARNLIAGAAEHDVLDYLPTITCPTLILAGDEDLLTPLSCAHEVQRRIAGSRICMLERAGHAMFLEQPARFAQEAAAFLQAVLLPG